jgi:hypothetical protein
VVLEGCLQVAEAVHDPGALGVLSQLLGHTVLAQAPRDPSVLRRALSIFRRGLVPQPLPQAQAEASPDSGTVRVGPAGGPGGGPGGPGMSPSHGNSPGPTTSSSTRDTSPAPGPDFESELKSRADAAKAPPSPSPTRTGSVIGTTTGSGSGPPPPQFLLSDIALTLKSLGAMDDAVAAFEQVLAVDPTTSAAADALLELGNVMVRGLQVQVANVFKFDFMVLSSCIKLELEVMVASS